MVLIKKTTILLLLAAMGFTTITTLLSSCQGSGNRKGSELDVGFKQAVENAETFKNIQLDSARHYAYEAHSLVCEVQGELKKHTSILLLSEIRFLQFGASDRLYKKVESCESWFRERKFYKKAFKANLLRLEIKSFLRGSHNVADDIDGLIQTANLSESNNAKAHAYYFKMDKRDYTRKWEDDIQILDSARLFATRSNDSVLLAKIRIMSVLPINGSPASLDSSHLSLKQAEDWNNSELKCMSYASIGKRFSPSRRLDSALFYLQKGIKESDKLGSLVFKMKNTQEMTLAYMYSFEYDSVINSGNEGLKLARKVQNGHSERRILDDISSAWLKKGEYSKSITTLIMAMKIAKEMNSKQGVFTLKRRLLALLTKTKRFEEADKVFDEMLLTVSKKERNSVNDVDRAGVYYRKGHLERTKKNLDTALFFYRKSTEYFKLYDLRGTKRLYVEEAILLTLLELKQYEKAREKYEFIVKSFPKISLNNFQFLHMKGQLFFNLNEFDKAILALKSSLDKGQGKFLDLHYKSCFTLSEIYEKIGDYRQALLYNRKGLELKKEHDQDKDELELEKVQFKYELSQKETEIQKLDIESLKQKKSIDKQENTLQTRRLYIIFLCILLVLLAVIVISISRRAKETIVRKELQRSSLEKEQQIERLKTEESERTIELKNQLFANISHEFRTPLTLIQVPVEELMVHASLEDQNSLQVVKRNADHLLVMVDEILELTRLDSGNTEISKKSFDIHAFIREFQMNFEPVFRQNSIEFEIDLPKEEYRVLADEYRLKMVLNNLLKNAFHHTPKKGVIRMEVVANREEETLELALFNSGDWIDEAFLPTIFDRYARSKEKEYSGYGIGLSFCKQIISLHDGEINARNVDGGVLLSFSIPTKFDLVEISMVPIDEPNIHPIDESVENRENTILIVEDNPEVQNLLKDVLSGQYDIILAANGEEGIEKAMEDQPDLIISDIMMPKVGGTELAATLKENFSTSHIPIILLTAKSAGHDRITGLETGADDYLTKPFSPKELKVRVRNLIKQREKLQRRFSKNVFLMPDEISSNSLDQEFLIRATDIVEAKLLNSGFNVEKFCRELSLNRNSVHQKLKSLIGLSASQFIKSVKLKKATTFLADERISIVEVSELSGFNNRQAFNKAFKDQFEMTPSEYRKECLDMTK